MGAFQFIQAQCRANARGIAGRLFGHAQVADFDALLGTDDARPLDHVAQFADVARPAVVEQRGAGLVAEGAGRARVFLDEAGKEAIGQGEDIFTALAQGRQVQGDDVQAVQQVFAKAPFADHVLEVEVGRGQNPHIGAAGHRVADALVFFVLDKTQQLGLQGQREIADFIEEQGPAVSLVDPPQGAFAGTGKGPAAVAEQLAFHQLGSQRRAVDGHAGFARAFAPAVNGAGQFALTGTGLPKNEDVGVGGGNLASGFQHHHHGRAV